MLIKAGDVIFNSENIIRALYEEVSGSPRLHIIFVGDNPGAPRFNVQLYNDEAKAAWDFLCGLAQDSLSGLTSTSGGTSSST